MPTLTDVSAVVNRRLEIDARVKELQAEKKEIDVELGTALGDENKLIVNGHTVLRVTRETRKYDFDAVVTVLNSKSKGLIQKVREISSAKMTKLIQADLISEDEIASAFTGSHSQYITIK